MVGGRVIMESSVLGSELVVLQRRMSALEEQVRLLTAANLALAKALEDLQGEQAPLAPAR